MNTTANTVAPATIGHRVRRSLVLSVVLALTLLLVPDAATPRTDGVLVRVEGAHAVDAGQEVVWILALGSDARTGQPVLASRADAIQLVALDAQSGHATVIGIPRDSYVDIPGHGRDKLNAAMVYGGPQLTAQAVAGLVGHVPDYVFTTSFRGLQSMISVVGGVEVYSPFAWSTSTARIHRGRNHLNGTEALAFARMRHALPRGDFDRSLDQGRLLAGTLRRVRDVTTEPGQLERLLVSFLKNTDVDLPPAELYRLARAVLEIEPQQVQLCPVGGGTGYAGSASVVFPDIGRARSLIRRASDDARVEGGC